MCLSFHVRVKVKMRRTLRHEQRHVYVCVFMEKDTRKERKTLRENILRNNSAIFQLNID